MTRVRRTTSRTLLRFVFPQFAVRLTLILAVIAVVLVAMTRSFQIRHHMERVDALDIDPIGIGVFLGVVLVLVLVVVFVTTYRVVIGISRPLGELRYTAERFAAGELQYRATLDEPRELALLAQTMNEMASQLQDRIASIRTQQTQLEAILGSMVEGVILVDWNLRIRTINAAARRLFGVESVINPAGDARTLLEVIRNSELHDFVQKTLDAATSQETNITIYTTPPRYMQVHGTTLSLEGEDAVLLVLNDITRLKELENIRRDFVANVSHELKTPITSILGFVETLGESSLDDDDEVRRFLGIIAKQTHRLNAIIEDLLQLSRLEQQKAAIPTAECRAEEIIASVRQSVQEHADEKGIRIIDSYRGPTDMKGNANLLQQALTNLVDNAIKYCPGDSEVSIEYDHRGESAVFTVRDDGPGIALPDQARVFERFFRTDIARSRSLGGTGLGLAIVKHIAKAHDGSVELNSVPGAGSTFILTIPQR